MDRQNRRKSRWDKLTPEGAAFAAMSVLGLVVLWWSLITRGKWDPELGLVFSSGQAIFWSVMLFRRNRAER